MGVELGKILLFLDKLIEVLVDIFTCMFFMFISTIQEPEIILIII